MSRPPSTHYSAIRYSPSAITTYVNPFARLPLGTPGLVTVTVTAPALPAGVVAVICVPLTTTTFVAAVPPNVTVAPVQSSFP